MKNIFKYSLLVFMAGACLSCEDSILHQVAQSTYDDAAVFSNETLARYAVNGIYYANYFVA